MATKTRNNETLYDLALRLYGDLRGVEYLTSQLDSVDTLPDEVEHEKVIFSKYVVPSQPVVKKEKVTFKVREGQSIYDLALQVTGKLSGLSEVLGNYKTVDQDIRGTEVTVDKNDDEQLDAILSKGLLFATKDLSLKHDAPTNLTSSWNASANGGSGGYEITWMNNSEAADHVFLQSSTNGGSSYSTAVSAAASGDGVSQMLLDDTVYASGSTELHYQVMSYDIETDTYVWDVNENIGPLLYPPA